MSLPLRRPSRDPDRPVPVLPRGPSGRGRWTGLRAAALGLAALATLGVAEPPAVGPQGLGDRLFPTLGNTGYDVTSYDVSLDYSGHNDRPLNVTTQITARATSELDHLNLDFARGAVRSVKIGGLAARHEQHGEDLVLTPAFHISRGQDLKISIEHTSDPGGKSDGGWIRTADGLAMANQADAAHRVFPCNDHPSDKALFTFHITAPQQLTAVANGLPLRPGARAGRRTWTYRTDHPMATELAQVSIGKSSVLLRHGPHGLPIRDVVPTADRAALAHWLAKTPGHVTWMERKVGPYPFEAYGVLIANARTGFELETQTLSLFEKALFTAGQLPDWYVESVMVHELAHQWFGNSVSPRRWSDVWLNEAHATWYEALFAQEKGDHRASLEARMRHAYEQSDGWRAEGGPPAAPKAPSPGEKISIFRPVVYDGSALVLYALRQKIGPAAFDRIEREWVARHRDGVADTADFVQLASQVAGQDLTAFFQGWLYGERTPPMPGHPQWQPRKGADKPGAEGAAPGPGAKKPAPTPGGPKAAAGNPGKPA
ncbi:M1 family metallopeptidase [Streptomyces platensis]|uniref:M1 family metallopeptidase n=1 Tax=Streptomyces platensis TaxID=58346 RepID=UPI002E7FD7AB|nr:M1 family metallopeptidase [Streptomyces platensis]WTI55012.1 M1 family metallopeptidase [Streptomyces platensis]WUB79426.1 M1 family metallopeptidase [Streptomyces platensis]